MKTAVDLKLGGIDWFTTYGHDPKEIKAMCQDAGLEIACYIFMAKRLMAGDGDWLDEVKRYIEEAVVLGAPVIMIPTNCNDSIARDEFRRFWIRSLGQIAPLTDQAGVVLTIENFPGKYSAFVTAADFFEAENVVPQYPARYMLLVLPLKSEKADSVSAVNHMGTGRLQTVRRDWNPRYYRIVKQFGEATGVPVLLNTSFNLRGEPIVNTPQNAFNTFSRSGIDVLVLENYMIRKSDG